MTRRLVPLLIGAVPFLMLVFALPFVNRVEPVILGLPFILFWIMLWIALCPPLLYLAYRVEKRPGGGPDEDEQP
jgi:hypothetical protein